MKEVHVVTCFLLRRTGSGDEVLLLKRSERVGTYRHRWSGVSGYLEARSAREQAYREVREETGLAEEYLQLLREGRPVSVPDESLGVTWLVHPFLFEVARPELVKLDWENVELRWLPPAAIDDLETVPGLSRVLREVYEG